MNFSVYAEQRRERQGQGRRSCQVCAPLNNAVASVSFLARTCRHADVWTTTLLVAGHAQGLAMAQRMGLDVLFLLRRAQGLVELGLGRFGSSANPSH